MLVALSIVLFLGVITFAFLPTVQDKQRVARGASLVQGWLAIAKNLAIRDGAPRGVRLRGVNNTSNLITSCQHVEQPDDLFQGGSITIIGVHATTGYDQTGTAPDGVPNSYTYDLLGASGVDFCGGFKAPSDPPGPFDPTSTANWPIQAGDYIDFKGGVTPSVLKFVVANTSPPPNPYHPVSDHLHATAQWASPTGYDASSTSPPPPPETPPATALTSYAIVRQPRLRVGSPSLDLPDNVAIDLSTNTSYGSALPVNSATNNIEIVFSPAGQVMGLGSGADKIQIWLRDTSADSTTSVSASPPLDPTKTFLGDQVIVTVFVRTGAISANTVDTTLDGLPHGVTGQQYKDPYAFTRDGRSSGL
jgi:hypothetical protein